MMENKIFRLFIYAVYVIVILAIIHFSYALYKGADSSITEINGDTKTYRATFYKNGADSISSSSLTCEVINDKCQIQLPTIIKEDGYVLGWNTENVDYAKYQVSERIELTENQTFYAITYHENTLTIFDDSLDYLSDKEISCKVYNKEESCDVIIPSYNKEGYENRGYSLRQDSLTGTIFPNSTYTLKKDITLYPIYNTLTRGTTIIVNKTVQKYGITIEIENGCSSSVYNNYLSYLDKISNKANYLLFGSKITFLNNNTFNKIWGENYVGMNYGPNAMRLVDVKCPLVFNSDYYPTIVHELAHTWDFHYRNYFKKNISDENDYVNLYSKYSNDKNRPFRDYSYTNIREFFADSIRFYYFKYLDPKTGYKSLDYPNDIKQVVEKYICIANNNYSKNNSC